jgi:hypothetical protein
MPVDHPPIATEEVNASDFSAGVIATPQRKSRRMAKKQARRDVLKTLSKELVDKVWAHRDDLQINADGYVIGANGRPIADSHYKDVVADMLSPSLQKGAAKGAVLKGKITRHPTLGPLYQQYLHQKHLPAARSPVPKSAQAFKPQAWSS